MAFLTALQNFASQLQASLPGTTLNTPQFSSALSNQISMLQELVSLLQPVQNGTAPSASLGTLNGATITVTSADLGNVDNIIQSVIGATLTSPSSMALDLHSRELTADFAKIRSASAQGSTCQQTASAQLCNPSDPTCAYDASVLLYLNTLEACSRTNALAVGAPLVGAASWALTVLSGLEAAGVAVPALAVVFLTSFLIDEELYVMMTADECEQMQSGFKASILAVSILAPAATGFALDVLSRFALIESAGGCMAVPSGTITSVGYNYSEIDYGGSDTITVSGTAAGPMGQKLQVTCTGDDINNCFELNGQTSTASCGSWTSLEGTPGYGDSCENMGSAGATSWTFQTVNDPGRGGCPAGHGVELIMNGPDGQPVVATTAFFPPGC